MAGKLTGKNNFEIAQNVAAAEDVGLLVAEAGAMPLIPHSNTGLKFFGTINEQFWYDGTMELLRRCDAVIMVPGWEASKGAQAEREEALRMDLPVLALEWHVLRITAIKAWLSSLPKKGKSTDAA